VGFWDTALKWAGAAIVILVIVGGLNTWADYREKTDRASRASICQYNNLPIERCYPP